MLAWQKRQPSKMLKIVAFLCYVNGLHLLTLRIAFFPHFCVKAGEFNTVAQCLPSASLSSVYLVLYVEKIFDYILFFTF